MNNPRHRALAALVAVSLPLGVSLTPAPLATAATVLVSEGLRQERGSAQTAFNGAFCKQNTCRSISSGPLDVQTSSRQLQDAVDATPGDIILVGYSLGAAGTYDRLREWERDPDRAPDPERVILIVTYGNPVNKFGGADRRLPGTGLPAHQPYQHLDVVAQYDSVADRPTRFGLYSAINAQFARHFAYFEDIDIDDPDHLVYRDGNTTYMLIEAKTLPMLVWVQPFVSEQRMSELDARFRPLVERDYDRPDYVRQGEGADWGNGTPPPSVAPPSVATAQEPSPGAFEAAEQPATVQALSGERRSQAAEPEVDYSPDDGTDYSTDEGTDYDTDEAEDAWADAVSSDDDGADGDDRGSGWTTSLSPRALLFGGGRGDDTRQRAGDSVTGGGTDSDSTGPGSSGSGGAAGGDGGTDK